MRFDTVIVGAGAAGMMAAVTAAKQGRKVAVIEKNSRNGKKLRITGKGRCNVTNNCDIDSLMDNIPVNNRFLYSAFSKFSPQAVMEFFESAGVPLKTERGNRVFPVSDNAADIVNALESEMKKYGVKLIRDRVTDIITDDGVCCGVTGEKGEYISQTVLIATGGASYPLTGSTGDGYKFAADTGHSITEIVPSLVPLEIKEDLGYDINGLLLKNVTLTLYDRNKKIYSELGEMSFAHFGVTGPLVLTASSRIRNMSPDRYRLVLDIKPGLTPEKLEARIMRDFSEFRKNTFAEVMRKLLPAKLIQVISAKSGIKSSCCVSEITREKRAELVRILKNFDMTVKNFRPVEEAIITSGGVSVKDIDPKTMESKKVSGLFFAGEIIDADGYTGGFNLQIAFSTGYTAGLNL